MLPNGEERLNDLYECFEYINLYNRMMMARELGIRFSTSDISQEEFQNLCEIHKEVSEFRDRERKNVR